MDEGAQARQGINLLRGITNIRPSDPVRCDRKSRTDPYCPPVSTTPSDDAPFIIEIADELPAGIGKEDG